MNEPLIVTEALKRNFGEVQALKGVDLQVEQGSVFGLLGPNGAGKTTAVKILTTLIEPSSGRATVAGFDVVKDAERLRQRDRPGGTGGRGRRLPDGPGEPRDGGTALSPRQGRDEAPRGGGAGALRARGGRGIAPP